MKETKQIIEELIDVQIGYYQDRKEISKYLEDQPVVLAMLESYTKRINSITDIIIDDILEIPDEPSNCKYEKENFYKRSTKGILAYTVSTNGKYKDSAIELILDWKGLSEATDKLEEHGWFYYEQLLEEHNEGFPTYKQQLEKEKKKSTKKTSA